MASQYDKAFDQLLLKTYDKYVPRDYVYDEEVGNLNPKREVEWSKPVTEQVMARLQKITDDIVRRQVQPRPEPERVKTSMMPESLPTGIPLPMLQAISATGGSSPIFQIDEMLQDLVPYLPSPFIDELMLPPEIDCDEILGALGFTQDEIDGNRGENRDNNRGSSGGNSDDSSNDDGSGDGGDGSGSGDGGIGDGGDGSDDGSGDGSSDGDGGVGSGDGDDDGDGGDDDDDLADEADDADDANDEDEEAEFEAQFEETDYDDTYAACAGIELGWLKILLAIAKVIAMLKKIISMVLAILIPIIEIIQLACGAWLNPTNIGKIIQFIVQLIIALVVMIIAMIIQLIWDLLNLDCIIDDVKATIDEIKKVLSAFASLTNQFNPTAVGLMMDSVKASLLDPLESAAEQFKNNADAWRDAWNETKDLFSNPEARAKMMGELENQLVTGVSGGVKQDPNLNRAASLSVDVKGTFGVKLNKDANGQMKFSFDEDSSLGDAMKSVSNLSDWGKKDNATKKSAGSMAESTASSKQFVGMAFTPKQSTDDTSKAGNAKRKTTGKGKM
jgi:hypothetical protein